MGAIGVLLKRPALAGIAGRWGDRSTGQIVSVDIAVRWHYLCSLVLVWSLTQGAIVFIDLCYITGSVYQIVYHEKHFMESA